MKTKIFITRLDSHTEDNNGVRNVGKTLETMRNRLNNYLGDVDNASKKFKTKDQFMKISQWFFKIRKPNQQLF